VRVGAIHLEFGTENPTRRREDAKKASDGRLRAEAWQVALFGMSQQNFTDRAGVSRNQLSVNVLIKKQGLFGEEMV
jgi:hypothetical protein